MAKPVHALPRDMEVEDIVKVAAIAVVDARENEVVSWSGATAEPEVRVGD